MRPAALSAKPGPTYLSSVTAGEGVRPVPIADVVESTTNPRTVFVGIPELAESILAQGIIEPLIVRLSQANGRADRYEIVAGARRFRAAKLAKLANVPAIVRSLSDEQVLEVQLVENLQREGMTPLDEARGYHRLRTEAKLRVEQIAQKIGKSIEHVYARLKLLALETKPAEALAGGKISAEHAVLLARLPAKDQAEGLGQCTRSWNPLSVHGLRQWVKERDDVNKTQERIQGEISRAKAKGEKVVMLLEHAGGSPVSRGALGTDKYALAGKAKCAHLARGFYVESAWVGGKRKQVYEGTSALVCTNPATCAAHKPTKPKKTAPSPAATAWKIRQQIDELTEERVAAAFYQAVDRVKGLTRNDLRDIALRLIDDRHYACDEIAKRHGIAVKKNRWSAHADALTAVVKKCRQRGALERWILELAFSGAPFREIEQAARKRRVDVARIRRQAAAEVKAARKKKGKAKR